MSSNVCFLYSLLWDNDLLWIRLEITNPRCNEVLSREKPQSQDLKLFSCCSCAKSARRTAKTSGSSLVVTFSAHPVSQLGRWVQFSRILFFTRQTFSGFWRRRWWLSLLQVKISIAMLIWVFPKDNDTWTCTPSTLNNLLQSGDQGDGADRCWSVRPAQAHYCGPAQ